WSDIANWNPNGSVGGNSVLFANAGGTSSATGGTTSVIDQNFNISSLAFTNTGNSGNAYQNLVIGNGGVVTLSVTGAGGLSIGTTAANTTASNDTNVNISGPGALAISNTSANFVLGLGNTGSSANGPLDNLNMSGLSTFSFSGASFGVGSLQAG